MTSNQERGAEARPSPWQLFLIWSRLSISSFGGGVATLGLIQLEFVTRRRWFSEEEFLREWSLCQLAPGINLIAFTILIGRKMGGALAVFASLMGMLLPSGTATILITAAYAYFANSPFVTAARVGIGPAVAGVGLATAWSMLVPIARKHVSTGIAPSVAYALLLAGCFYAQRILQISPVLVFLTAGVVGALFSLTQPKRETGS